MDDSLQAANDIDNIEIASSIECDCSNLSEHIFIKQNDLTMVSQNIRSVYCNFDNFMVMLSTFKFELDLIILTECRLNTSKPLPQIPNYDCHSTTRQMNQNDGVVIYVKNTLKPKISEIQLSQASCIQVDILNNTVLCIYRSPSHTNIDSFLDSLSLHLDRLPSQKNIVIAGDININIRIKENETSHERTNRNNYLSMLSVYGILAGHSLPTRDRNCLDHFMIRLHKKKTSASIAILHTTVTDHYTTFLALSKIKNKVIPNKTTTKLNYEQALKYLQEKNLSELMFCSDPELLTELLIQKLSDCIINNTITSNIPNSKRIIKPWITQGILRCIKNRNKMQKSLRADPYNTVLKITFCRYRNYCNNLIKKLKRKYERELITKSIKNTKLLWKNIKSITYTNKYKNQNTELLNAKPSPTESVNFVNDYFVNIGKKLAHQIQNNNTHFYQPCHLNMRNNSFVLINTDAKEVENTLMGLKSNSAPGWDNISTSFLKYCHKEVVPIITHLINLCFNSGIFPTLLKKSIITPVHKGGNRDDVNNYRPISVLPAISKIVEKLTNTRLVNYLNKFKIISSSQFGFRQGVSTEDAIDALSSLVTEHLDAGKKCITVFLDIKKAFDTVSVLTLVAKLEGIGIRGTPLNFFKNYLTNRKQRVKMGTYTSDDADVLYGVPQGSVLGPTLFLTYINDLCNLNVKNATIFSYADDTAVVFSGDNWYDVKLKAELGMIQIANWLRDNLLSLNTTKTNYICFSISNHSQDEPLNIKIHTCNTTSDKNCKCPIIEKVSQTKYLGIIIDQKLSWYSHIEHITARLRKLGWIFKSLRHILPKNIKHKRECSRNLLNEIYISLAQSVIVYCIPVWGGAAKTKFIILERGQRSLIKIMYFKKIRYSTEKLYELSGLLSVRKLYIIYTVLKKHKTLAYDPKIMSKRRKDLIAQIPPTRTKFAAMQYQHRSARLYNRVNKQIFIYPNKLYDCKQKLTDWIKPFTYTDTESLLQHMN
ncbi:hypothetical protein PYW08_015368 [Mythimna loreyi]|uniref:Uncharacterized protein n=1 Tax=Mythimna loreyi TaxID=667449 RepID=A0ACC2QZP2_9NEOP|nr:hypothetical protein PYW08_015368 [Mythimna loreyi]